MNKISTSSSSKVAETAKDCSSAHTYLHTITDIQSKGHSIPDYLTLNMNSDTQNHSLFKVQIHEWLSTGAGKRFQEITYLYSSQYAYNKSESPLIIYTSEPNKQSNTFVQLSDGNYLDGSNHLIKSYNEIIESIKERNLRLELSEEVKFAIAKNYPPIPDEIRRIYDTAVKEQKEFDSRFNNPR